MFPYTLIFNDKEFLVPRPTPEVVDYTLLAICDSLISTLIATLCTCIGRLHPQRKDASCHSFNYSPQMANRKCVHEYISSSLNSRNGCFH